ncbi:MAG: hypothetical protein JNK81_13835 [Anaerolineales bacterium]|nr:hypothetical protein [Anaerolineales bacterium]
MDYSLNWVNLSCFACIGALVLAGAIPFIKMLSSQNKKITERLDKERAERQSIRENGGITALAIIKSARWEGARNKFLHTIYYDVEVQPDGQPTFQAKFRDEVFRRNIQSENYEIVSEIGLKIWVTYDPANPSRMFVDRYDDESNSI